MSMSCRIVDPSFTFFMYGPVVKAKWRKGKKKAQYRILCSICSGDGSPVKVAIHTVIDYRRATYVRTCMLRLSENRNLPHFGGQDRTGQDRWWKMGGWIP